MDTISIIVKLNRSTYVRYQDQYLSEISDMLSEFGLVEIPEVPVPKGAGVTIVEVVEIYLATKILDPFLDEAVRGIADKFIDWVTRRNKKNQGPTQKVHVTIYGPDNKPLKTIECDRNGRVQESPSNKKN